MIMNWALYTAYSALGLWVITSIIFIYKANKKFSSVNPYIFDSIPGVFTTIGIFGTFIGITYALFEFDVNNIEGSIPGLLTGMKTAFLTSIVGIVFSFISSKFVSIAQKKGDVELKLDSAEVIKLGELISVLKDSIDLNQKSFDELRKAISSDSDDSLSTHFVKLRTLLKDEMNDNRVEITKVVQALGGDNETSILSQIQRLRTGIDSSINSFNDLKARFISHTDSITTNVTNIKNILKASSGLLTQKFESYDLTFKSIDYNIVDFSNIANKNLIDINQNLSKTSDLIYQKFDEFTTLLEKSNTEALVKAIENVIGGFNERLNELLERLVKENFEELNRSVQLLNSWQQENKEMIIRLTSQFKEVADNLQISGKTLVNISNSTNKLVADDSILVKLIKELENVMIENTTFRDSMKMLNTSTAEIQGSSRLLNDWMRREEKFADAVKNLIVSLKAIEDLKNQTGQFWNDIRQNLSHGSNVIKENSNKLMNQVNQLDEEFQNRLNLSFKSLDKILQAMVQEYHKRAQIN